MDGITGIALDLGLGILSDGFIEKIRGFADKKSIKNFVDDIQAWEIEFEKSHDGTIATRGEFYSYITNHKVIENIVWYVLDTSSQTAPEDDFLASINRKMLVTFERDGVGKLSHSDRHIVLEFLSSVHQKAKDFAMSKISIEDRGIMYILCQILLSISEYNKESFEFYSLTDSKISDLQRQISLLLQQNEKVVVSKEVITEWNTRQIKNLGNRYLPDLHVPIEVTNVFNYACLSKSSAEEFRDNIDSLLIACRKIGCSELEAICDEIAAEFCPLENIEGIPNYIEFLKMNAKQAEKLLVSLYTQTRDSHKKESKRDNYELYRIETALSKVYDFQRYIDSDEVTTAISPYVLLTGDGGIGKSHLIADFIEKQDEEGTPTLLLLGNQFVSGDPLVNLPSMLGLPCTYQELLKAIENMASEQNCRAVVCIDAINEGAGVGYWNSCLNGVIATLKKFPSIGLIVSIRTQYIDQLLKEQDTLAESLMQVTHTGFSEVAYEAMQKYFTFYNIDIVSSSILSNEFSTPLFLRLFCEANRGQRVSADDISLPSVYSKYLETIESRIAERCNYNKSYKIVSKVIIALVDLRFKENGGSSLLYMDLAIEVIVDICKKYNVVQDLYSALLSEGVLTQSLSYRGDEYVYITYERLEDYFLAERIVADYKVFNKTSFVENYGWIIGRADILQFFAIVLAEECAIELDEVFPDLSEHQEYAVCKASLYGLQWRKTETVTEHTVQYIIDKILTFEGTFIEFVDVLFALSARKSHRLNSENSFMFFQGLSMPDRDATFIEVFDSLYIDSTSSLSRLIEWGLLYAKSQNYNEKTAELSATILSWLLISPNNEIRDKATKAMIGILSNHIDALIATMERFSDIDDPYVLERIYAVAFGCAVVSDIEHLRILATYVYKNIFDVDLVYTNILLRDYAKNIIDYAFSLGCIDETVISRNKTMPPYKSAFPEIPTDEEIKGYKLDYKSEGFQQHHWSQNSILSSMKVEYSRDGQPGGYGDFGRYTFQSYFHAWKNLHPIDLKNIAIKRIFDLGYDVEKHGRYDRTCGGTDRFRLQQGKRERIEKKYQWIAMYELAAQVADNFPMQIYTDDRGGKATDYCTGSFEPNIRNIDPTITFSPTGNNSLKLIHEKLYSFPNNDHFSWATDFQDFPAYDDLYSIDFNGRRFVLLNGGYSWTEEKALGDKQYQNPQKDMWAFLNCYIVKDEYYKNYVEALLGKDFMGRWMAEPHENYHLYNKEYYWSEGFKFFQNPYYGGDEWVDISSYNDKISGALPKVLLPTFQYLSERTSDSFGENRPSWYKPCSELYEFLDLRYGEKNSILYDKNGRIICFDSIEVLNENIGFFIDQEMFNDFLKRNGYSTFWTLLAEKRILHDDHAWHQKVRFPMPHISAMYYYNNDKLVGNVKKYND